MCVQTNAWIISTVGIAFIYIVSSILLQRYINFRKYQIFRIKIVYERLFLCFLNLSLEKLADYFDSLFKNAEAYMEIVRLLSTHRDGFIQKGNWE